MGHGRPGNRESPSVAHRGCVAGFVEKELIRKGGVRGGPTKGRLFKLDFPSAKLWVFVGWVGLRPKRPSYNQSLVRGISRHVLGKMFDRGGGGGGGG